MSHENIIRAWKDENYRNSLSEQERALLPENPAGMSELSDEILTTIAGGRMAGDGSGTGANCTKVVSEACGYGTGAGTGTNCGKCK